MARNTLAKWTREDWIEQALEVLRREGHEAIRVERLAEGMGATKGSFYHHFRNRDELLTALWDDWRHRTLEDAFEAARVGDRTLEERLVLLSHIVADKNLGRYDRAMQAWSLTDERVAKAVARAYRERTEFVTSLFLQHGLSEKEASHRGLLFYSFLAASFIGGYENPTERIRKLCGVMSRIVTAPTPPGQPPKQSR